MAAATIMQTLARPVVFLRFLGVLFFLATMADARKSEMGKAMREASTARRLLEVEARSHSHWSTNSAKNEANSISAIFNAKKPASPPPKPAAVQKVTGDPSVDEELGGAMRMIVAKNAVKKAAAALEEAKKIYYAEEDKNHNDHFDPKAFSSRGKDKDEDKKGEKDKKAADPKAKKKKKKKMTPGWMVDGKKTLFWAAGGVVSRRRYGKVKRVTPSVTLAHPGLRFSTLILS
mmetsp:Transcript_35850/g.60412  ORF Transcript_35850/g.60412 Transcript_35850/m.60412 type:complete len:232 (+) Transcript_35850:185-880(+)